MLQMSDDEFSALIAEVIDEIPHEHMEAAQNVAIVYEDEPTPEQVVQLKLSKGQSLFGLYEGIPLTRRGGLTSYPPDKITIFKKPILETADNYEQLRASVKHTLWHEIAHFFGLDHPMIDAIEKKIEEGE